MKLCKDCKYVLPGGSHHSEAFCMAKGVPDYVLGESNLHPTAQIERMDWTRCGPVGLWFEKIEVSQEKQQKITSPTKKKLFWKFWRKP